MLYRKYGKSKKKKEKPNEYKNGVGETNETSDNDGFESLKVAVAQMSLEKELSCLLYFKTCLVEKEIDILKIKMRQTIDLREKVLRKNDVKFFEAFSFYFVAPDLVQY